MFKFLVFAFAFVILTESRTSDNMKVQLPDGSHLLGRYLTSITGRGIRAFMGVPYAEPPIGDLRFKVNLTNNIKFCHCYVSITLLLK